MRLIDVDRKPKVKYYVWAVPIVDNHFPGATMPDYIVNNKYFDTIEEAKKLKAECDNNGRWENYYINKKVEKFEDYPTVDAEPVRHGQWIEVDVGDCCYRCSECGFIRDAYLLDISNYCPKCGAKMNEEKENE